MKLEMTFMKHYAQTAKKVREKSRECHNHKPHRKKSFKMGHNLIKDFQKISKIESARLYIGSKLLAKFLDRDSSGSLDILLTRFSFTCMHVWKGAWKEA